MTACPLCGSNKRRSVLDGSPFYRCLSCGAVYHAAHSVLAYSDSYFTTEYRAQYGKTYEEDFMNIHAAAMRRMDRIMKLWYAHHSKKPGSVIDIGCAMGFFLKAAEDCGVKKIKGLEISKYASGRGKKLFSYDYIRKPFEKAEIGEKFDIVTAWYFIEHSYDSRAAFAKAAGLVKKGGVFAFSVPSVFGPSFLFSRKIWAETHPGDHRIDLTPRAVKKLMKELGFSRCVTYPAGIHPSRVMKESNILFPLFSPCYRLFSKWFSFSDTLEVYGIRG